jgi:uncharacterized membrane protein
VPVVSANQDNRSDNARPLGRRLARAVPLILSALVVLAYVVHVALVWDQLPQRMASHFGPSGRADAWTDRNGFFAMNALIILVMVAIPLAVPLLPPELFNLPRPHRDAWLARENRRALRATMATWLNWLIFLLTAFVVYLFDETVRIHLASGGSGSAELRLDGMNVNLVLFLAATGVWLIFFYRAFRNPPEP